jgi:hypothetical protein
MLVVGDHTGAKFVSELNVRAPIIFVPEIWYQFHLDIGLDKWIKQPLIFLSLYVSLKHKLA